MRGSVSVIFQKQITMNVNSLIGSHSSQSMARRQSGLLHVWLVNSEGKGDGEDSESARGLVAPSPVSIIAFGVC